jgi:hypothetical protein
MPVLTLSILFAPSKDVFTFFQISLCRIREAYRLGYKEQLDAFYTSSKSDDTTGPNITQFNDRFLNLSMEDLFLSTAHQAEDMIVG